MKRLKLRLWLWWLRVRCKHPLTRIEGVYSICLICGRAQDVWR